MCLVSRHTPAAASVMCGQSRVNLKKSKNPDKIDAVRVDVICFGERPCQLYLKKKDGGGGGGGGGRRYSAAQEHKTGTDQDRYYTAPPAHIPLLGGIGRRTNHGG